MLIIVVRRRPILSAQWPNKTAPQGRPNKVAAKVKKYIVVLAVAPSPGGSKYRMTGASASTGRYMSKKSTANPMQPATTVRLTAGESRSLAYNPEYMRISLDSCLARIIGRHDVATPFGKA
jgi:hypothetical protein